MRRPSKEMLVLSDSAVARRTGSEAAEDGEVFMPLMRTRDRGQADNGGAGCVGLLDGQTASIMPRVTRRWRFCEDGLRGTQCSSVDAVASNSGRVEMVMEVKGKTVLGERKGASRLEAIYR